MITNADEMKIMANTMLLLLRILHQIFLHLTVNHLIVNLKMRICLKTFFAMSLNPLRYQDIPHMKDYIENIVPNMMERDFISHFRLNRRTVGNLVCFINIFRLLALCYISISLYPQYESWLFFCRESYFYLKLQNGSKKAYELYCIF